MNLLIDKVSKDETSIVIELLKKLYLELGKNQITFISK